MLADNYPDEDHVHRATRPVDPSSLPPSIEPNLTRCWLVAYPPQHRTGQYIPRFFVNRVTT